MMLTNATNTHLWLAFSRLINPNITSAQFKDWYNTQLLPTFMQNHNASLGLRYSYIPSNTTSTSTSNPNPQAKNKWSHVAVYKTHENLNATLENLGARDEDVWKRDIGPNDVEIELSTWTPIQAFESLREKRGSTPKGRPGVVCIVRIEPKPGAEGEKDVEDWYRYQHLDMFSMLPNYRRATRYRSLDGSAPRWLAIHELDSTYVDPYMGEVMMGTELAHKVMDTVVTFEAANWGLIYEVGNEKL